MQKLLDQVDLRREWYIIKRNMMCGIVGYVGIKNPINVIMHGLSYLEYRGYDSAGLSLRHVNNSIVIKKALGKLDKLSTIMAHEDIPAKNGMGHTRWATHGIVSENNAHPHRYGQVTLIHNGIIENYLAIKQDLLSRGHDFYSHTDTEVIAHLLDELLLTHIDPLKAITNLCDKLIGSYALGIMIDAYHDHIYVAKKSSPLIVAKSKTDYYFASDQTALLDEDPDILILDDGDIGYIGINDVKIYNKYGQAKDLIFNKINIDKEIAQKNGHKYFMHKEIFEQPNTLDKVLAKRLDETGLHLDHFGIDFDLMIKAKKIDIIACGSAYFAGLIIRSYLEQILHIPINVEIASEYRYRYTYIDENTLVIAVSQSGETADTLAAFTKAYEQGALCMAITNVVGSAITRIADKSIGNFYLNAGLEISVASTKAFIAQVMALNLLAFALEKKLNILSKDNEVALYHQCQHLKHALEEMLAQDQKIRDLAQDLLRENRLLFIGRGVMFPIALEGALKIKELSYIMAEGYPGGELKHGPMATIDEHSIVIVIFSSVLPMKTMSSLAEVKARQARIISVLPKSLAHINHESYQYIYFADSLTCLEPILAAIPLQLLAYHLSDLKNIDVDKPRNLAKSVTVE